MRKKCLVMVICILTAALLQSCSQVDETLPENIRGNYIYYINGDKTGIGQKRYTLIQGEENQAIKDMIAELSEEATDVDHNPAIPKGSKVIDFEVTKSGILKLNLNVDYQSIDAVEKALSRAAIVDSLVQVDGVSGVQFLIEGEPMTDDAGNELGILDADSFVQNVGSTLNAYQTTTLTLYFANEAGDALKTETMDVKYSSNVAMEKLIIEHLMKGPAKLGNYRTINPDTIILGATIRDGICYVNFDEEFMNSIYDVKPEVIIYSLVNSLIDGTTATSVQISVNGETAVTYMDTIDLSQPLKKNNELMQGEGG